MRKSRRYRKQRGGSLWRRFPTLSFQLELPGGGMKGNEELLLWSNDDKDPKKLRGEYTLSMFEEGQADPLYTLRFTPHSDGRPIASVDYLELKRKTALFRHGSFLIMYKFLEILKSLGIEHVFFTVDARNDHWKLYSLYHDMGFVCVKEEESIMNERGYEYIDLSNLKTEYGERVNKNNEYFSKILENVKTMNEEAKQKLGFDIHMECYFMFGSVENVMEKIKKYVASQQGGKKTRKNKGNK